jgi:uncharacterized membrane protein YfcA
MLPWRRSVRPIYPGVLRMFFYGLILWGLSLLGIGLPIDLPRWLFLLLELLVVWYLWKGWKLARRAPRNNLRLFNAQDAWATAFALQALVIFLW